MDINLNDLITKISIQLKTTKNLDNLILLYGAENVFDALQFIEYDNKEILELEEDYG